MNDALVASRPEKGGVVKAWLNDGLVDERQAQVSVLDHGFTVGDGVFETLKVVAGQAFALRRHVERLGRSAAGLGLPVPDPHLVTEAVRATVGANAVDLAPLGRLRITLTSGPGALGSGRGAGSPTLVVVGQTADPWPATTAVELAPWPRNERSALTGLKTTSYAENALVLAWAKERGCSEALLANLRGELCEGTGSNVFVVMSGQLLTPPLASGCLAGITRELILQWCDVEERVLPVEVLGTATEVFITSSTRDIHPVVRLGDRSLSIGPVTRAAQEIWARMEAENLDP